MEPDAALATLDDGIQWAREEHRLLRAELTALESFTARLEAMEPASGPQPSPGPQAIRTLGGPSPSGGERLATVRKAYRETVMSVDHYDAEYGESFEQNVRNEFGPDLAETLEHGSTLPPPVYQRLRTAAHDALERRGQVLELLAEERQRLGELHTALIPVREELDDVDSASFREWSTAALRDEHDRIEALRDRCDRLAADRQCMRQEYVHEWSTLPDRPLTEGYLYQPLDTSYPGLTAVAVLADQLQEAVRDLRLVFLERDSSTDDGESRSSPPSADNSL